MRQINLNGIFYALAPNSNIVQRAVNPFKGKLGGTAGLEFSDFSSASIEEYHDFRNGIGLESALPDDSARLWWSEGIDFSTARSAVLGPLVTTAGSFGAAPVRILDFVSEGKTYAISNTAVKQWDAGESGWVSQGALIEDCEDAWNEYTDASVAATADTDVKQVGTASAKLRASVNVSSGNRVATEAISSLDLSSYTKVNLMVRSSVNKNSGDYQLLLDNTASCASPLEAIDLPSLTANTWTAVQLTLANPESDTAIVSVGIKAVAQMNTLEILYIDQIVADAYVGTPLDIIEVTDSTDTYLVIASADCAMIYDESTWQYMLDAYAPQGYLSWYDGKLYSISADGKTLNASPANDVDGTWTQSSLTGDFGTVYGMFTGKLLTTAESTLYMHSNKGLWSIDVANAKAYKQEVDYPPHTNAGRAGMYWNANIWQSTAAGILKISSNMATGVGPDLDDGLPSGFQGHISAMATVGNWLIYAVNGGSSDKSSILKRNASLGGSLQIYSTSATNKAIACIHCSPSSLYTNGRLWFGESTDIKYMMMPDLTQNVKQISSYEYVNDSGTGELPVFRKLAAIGKTALGVAAVTKSCDSNEYVELFYGLNGANPTTSLGTYITSPRPTILTFNSGLGTTFYTIQFAIKLYRGGTAGNSPELESLMFYYLPTPSTILGWTFRIQATDHNAAKIISEFETIRDTNTLVAFYPSGDTSKTSYNVKLTQMPLVFHHEEQGGIQGFIEVACEEIFKG